MDGWKRWEGKKVFIILKNNRQYSGKIIEVESKPNSVSTWITIKDKFGNIIGFSVEEIKVIQEEKQR